MKASKPVLFPPLVFNVFKPARISSYDVVRHFKQNLPPGYGKIGHFGTLDPFACGVLMIGIGGAARLNDFIHEFLPKTYLAVGKLGIETPTGDCTSEIIQRDETAYFKEIASLPASFIQEKFQQKFLGDYWQAPHKYSAAKFMGKNLHQWAREGVEVKKEAVLRQVYKIEVVKFSFPYLSIRVQVSSGTYIRTLFSDMANYLGTIGSLVALVREGVGEVHMESSLKRQHWPKQKALDGIQQAVRIDEILPFAKIKLNEEQVRSFRNGAFFRPADLTVPESGKLSAAYIWMLDEADKLLGLAEQCSEKEIRPKINFGSEGLV
jgi:tRNA pseudouridine55 synthase